MMDLTAADFANWQDRRLSEVSPGSVIRDMNLLSAVLTVCVKELGSARAQPYGRGRETQSARVEKPQAVQVRNRGFGDLRRC